MRLKLAYKLFGAFFLILVIVAGAMMVSRYMFSLNFKKYIHQAELQRLESLVPVLQEMYRTEGSWNVLKTDGRRWRRMMHVALDMPAPPPPPPMGAGPPHGFKPSAIDKHPPHAGPPPDEPTEILLLDARRQAVVGNPGPKDPRKLMAIEVGGQVVGWLGLRRHEPMEDGPPADFLRHQARQLYLLVGSVIGLTALIAFLFSRHLLRPIRRLADGTRDLADRNFSVRIKPTTGDELGQLAENFNAMAHILEAYEKMRLQWLTDISHELRTPLAILRGEIEALQDGVREPTTANLASLQTETAGLSKLVDDLHLLSMADSDRLFLNPQWISPGRVLEVTIESFRSRFDQCQITIDTRLSAADTVHIKGDADRLTQVFTNIFENACKYVRSPGTLRISSQSDDCFLTLQFEDSGPGVPDEALPRLFDRLYRVDASRNRESGGSGLGLSICRHIIENHHGRIWAQSNQEGGLCININFPLIPKENEQRKHNGR